VTRGGFSRDSSPFVHEPSRFDSKGGELWGLPRPWTGANQFPPWHPRTPPGGRKYFPRSFFAERCEQRHARRMIDACCRHLPEQNRRGSICKPVCGNGTEQSLAGMTFLQRAQCLETTISHPWLFAGFVASVACSYRRLRASRGWIDSVCTPLYIRS